MGIRILNDMTGRRTITGFGSNEYFGKQHFGAGLSETDVVLAGNVIDLSLGNSFTKTISGATTLSVINAPAAGRVSTFMLTLINPATNVTFFSGVKWPAGASPGLTTSGKDMLGFLTSDGGATWMAFVVGKDLK